MNISHQTSAKDFQQPFYIGICSALVMFIVGYLNFRFLGNTLYNDSLTVLWMDPIGFDLLHTYKNSLALSSGIWELLKVDNFYPPFLSILFYPLTYFKFKLAYQIFSCLTAFSLFASIYFCVAQINPSLERKLLVLLALLGTAILMQTYPVNFELERGNCNILGGFLVCMFLYLLQRQKVLFAIIILAIAIQIKIYFFPLAIFLLRTEKFFRNSLIFLFISLFFFNILGIYPLEKFISSIAEVAINPWVYSGNHSLYSFVKIIIRTHLFNESIANSLAIGLYAITIALFFFATIFYILYLYQTKNNRQDFFSPLSPIEIGVIGVYFSCMSLLVSISHDYKLPIQLIPFLLLLSLGCYEKGKLKVIAKLIFAIAGIAIGYLFLPSYAQISISDLGLGGAIDLGALNAMLSIKTPALLVLLVIYFAVCGRAFFTALMPMQKNLLFMK